MLFQITFPVLTMLIVMFWFMLNVAILFALYFDMSNNRFQNKLIWICFVFIFGLIALFIYILMRPTMKRGPKGR